MADSTAPTPADILQFCADAAPKPWFPSAFAKATGADRDGLDEPLSVLRLAGLVQISGWEPGAGQGYTLTDNGRVVLDSPRALARLREGFVPVAAAPAEQAAVRGSTWERGETVRDALLTRSVGPVTFALMTAQVVVFALGMYFAQRAGVPLKVYLEQGVSPMIAWLGVSAPGLAMGQWWRLISYCFVHGGALHLIFNLMGHGVFGPPSERLFGPWRYLAIWVASGIGGGCAAVYANPAGAIGSSGALCGLVGALVAGVFLNRHHLGPQLTAAWRRVLTQVIVMTVIISLVPHVSAAGHAGGAAVGLVIGVFAHYQRFGIGWQRWAAVLGMIAVPFACVATLLNVGPMGLDRRDVRDFETRVLPAVNEITDLTATVLKNVLPVVDQPPDRRDAIAVKEALENIARVRPQLDDALKLITQAGPYHTPFVETARHTAEEFLAAQRRYVQRLDNALRATDLIALDRPSLERAERAYEAAGKNWRSLFR